MTNPIDFINPGESLTIEQLGIRANETYTGVKIDFRGEVLKALANKQLILTSNRQLVLPDDSEKI